MRLQIINRFKKIFYFFIRHIGGIGSEYIGWSSRYSGPEFGILLIDACVVDLNAAFYLDGKIKTVHYSKWKFNPQLSHLLFIITILTFLLLFFYSAMCVKLEKYIQILTFTHLHTLRCDTISKSSERTLYYLNIHFTK